MEYDCLSLGLKDYIEKYGHQAISARALLNISVSNIRQIFGDAPVVPLEEERARLLREVCSECLGCKRCSLPTDRIDRLL